MIKYDKSTVASIQSAIVSQFGVMPTFKKWFLKVVKVSVQHDSLDAM
jgi:hypothetical protein